MSSLLSSREDYRFLFRGVSCRLYAANEGLLKPKSQGPFTYSFHWNEPGLLWGGGADWGESSTNAAIRHQLGQQGFPTAGISTTPHFQRAAVYARGKDGTAGGYVFKIDRGGLKLHGVSEFVVASLCEPSVPEDDEVILVTSGAAHLPLALITDIVPVDCENT